MTASPIERTAAWIWAFGPFELDAATFELRRNGETIPLEPKAIDVLRLLLERAPDTVEKSEIFSVVWKDVSVTDNALTRVVAQLRRALGDPAKQPEIIATVATRGYRVLLPVERRQRAAPNTEPTRPVETTAAQLDGLRTPERRVDWRLALAAFVALAAVIWFVSSVRAPVKITVAIPGAERGEEAVTLSTLVPRQVTTGDGFDGHASFSPDRTAMAFTSDRSGALEIYVQSLEPGSTPRQVTSDRKQNVEPSWSPDGRYIAYHQAGGNGIWIVPAQGGTARQVAPRGARPAWSPDSRFIAYQTMATTTVVGIDAPAATSVIEIVDTTTLGIRELTHRGKPAGPHLVPQWSADGTRVSFVETPSPYMSRDGRLWSVDVATGALSVEASSAVMAPERVASRDGRGAFVVGRGTASLWWQPIGPERARPTPTGLAVRSALLSHLAQSADGRLLAWTGTDATTRLWSIDRRPGGTWGDAHQLTTGLGVTAFTPAPTPAGVLYSSLVSGGSRQISLTQADGSSRQLTVDEGEHVAPVWVEPLGAAVYFATHARQTTLNALDIETGRERVLFAMSDVPVPPGGRLSAVAYSNVAPSPSFEMLAVTIVTYDVPNIWVVDLKNGRPSGQLRQLTHEAEGASFPEWSPDGRWVSYQCAADDGDTNVCAIQLDGTGRKQLTAAPGQNWNGGWIGKDRVLCASRRGAVWNVHAVTLDGRDEQVTHFTDATTYTRRPRWDAQHSRVVFERSAPTVSRIWMVDLRMAPAPTRAKG